MEKQKVYVSYAWGPEKEAEPDKKVVESLEKAMAEHQDMDLIRDIKRLKYGESIRAFMREIGAADHVVVVLSDAYLKSPNCMFELLAIEEQKQLHKLSRKSQSIV